MKRIVAIAAVVAALGIVLQPVAQSAKPKMRSAKAPYNFDLTKPGASAWFGSDLGVFFGDTVELATKPSDLNLTLNVIDDSGRAVSAAVWQEGDDSTVFCQSLARPVPVIGGEPVFVQVIVDVTPAGLGCQTPAPPTTGTVSAMFNH